jgi:predicted RNA-binding Zn-ribbon protein involved in translation (DUF1610 family)
MRFEEYNDMQERTVPIQGGGLWLVEWDNSLRTHTTIGEVAVSLVHPKQIVPQAGVYTGIEDMDYIILKMPQTKAYIKRKYGVDVKDETEEEPEVKGGEEESAADDMVTQYVAYYRNDTGGIGLFSWVRDTVLEDLDDYQARRLKRCKSCGAVLPYGTKGKGGKKPVCPNCGGTKFVDAEEEYEEIIDPIPLADGTMIPGAQMIANEDGTFTDEPTKIPYYKPDIYPVILQKNVSLFGKLLGDSVHFQHVLLLLHPISSLGRRSRVSAAVCILYAFRPAAARPRGAKTGERLAALSRHGDQPMLSTLSRVTGT